eukprot:340454_1
MIVLVNLKAQTAFVGSENFDNDYVNASIGGNELVRDTLCRLEGPTVANNRGLLVQTLSDARTTLISPHLDGGRLTEDSLSEPPAVVASMRPVFCFISTGGAHKWRLCPDTQLLSRV